MLRARRGSSFSHTRPSSLLPLLVLLLLLLLLLVLVLVVLARWRLYPRLWGSPCCRSPRGKSWRLRTTAWISSSRSHLFQTAGVSRSPPNIECSTGLTIESGQDVIITGPATITMSLGFVGFPLESSGGGSLT